MNEPIAIEYLAGYPQFVLIIASQILDYWGNVWTEVN